MNITLIFKQVIKIVVNAKNIFCNAEIRESTNADACHNHEFLRSLFYSEVQIDKQYAALPMPAGAHTEGLHYLHALVH